MPESCCCAVIAVYFAASSVVIPSCILPPVVVFPAARTFKLPFASKVNADSPFKVLAVPLQL